MFHTIYHTFCCNKIYFLKHIKMELAEIKGEMPETHQKHMLCACSKASAN